MFCRTHLAAPAGKRGGWLSAYRRRRILGGGMDEPLDASNVAKRLWIGARPPFDRDLPQFDILVLCAEELQPERVAFHGIVVRCPLPDAQLDDFQTQRALVTGKKVAKALAEGRTVLVTCYMGRNRSALVAGLGLGLVTRMSGDTIVSLIRARRGEGALSNTHFVKMLRQYVPKRRPAPREST